MTRVNENSVVTDVDADRAPESGPDPAIEPVIDALFGSTEGADEVDARLEADERAALADAGLDPDAVAEKEYAYRTLLEAGVEEGVAAALRRRFSLPWSFEPDGDLDRRSDEVRGLGDAEREWIAVSGDERWQDVDPEGAATDAERESTGERPYPRPTPATAVAGVGPDDADRLAEGGIRSAERLATVDATAVANALDLDVLHVRTWRYNARELLD